MFLEWARTSRTARFIFGLGLLSFLLAAILTGGSLLIDHLSGIAVSTTQIGQFALWASFIPLFLTTVFPGRPADHNLENDMRAVRIFEQSHTNRIMYVSCFWSVAVGSLILALTSDGSLWPPAIFALSTCLGVYNLFQPPARLALSEAGIEWTGLKAGRISWQDVRHVKLDRSWGSQFVAIELIDSKKYNLKKPLISLSSLLFDTTTRDLLNATEGRFAIFGRTISTMHPSLEPPSTGG